MILATLQDSNDEDANVFKPQRFNPSAHGLERVSLLCVFLIIIAMIAKDNWAIIERFKINFSSQSEIERVHS